MTKLRRTYEQASTESRAIEEVAIERYGTLKDFEDAVEERKILDERAGRRESRGRGGPAGGSAGAGSGSSTPGGQERYMFTSDAALSSGGGSRPGSRAGFRRPGEEPAGTPSSASAGAGEAFTGGAGAVNRVDSLRRGTSFQSPSQPSTPIPSVLMPTQHLRPAPPTPLNLGKPALSPSELNKLQAAVLKARLMDSPDASRLEAEYDAEMARARRAAETGMQQATAQQDGGKGKGREGAPNGEEVRVEMMPTLDGRGKLYDVGLGGKEEAPLLPGNRRKVVKVSWLVLFAALLSSLLNVGRRAALLRTTGRDPRSQDRRPPSAQRRRRHDHPRRSRPRGEVRCRLVRSEEHGRRDGEGYRSRRHVQGQSQGLSYQSCRWVLTSLNFCRQLFRRATTTWTRTPTVWHERR